ncbi:MAG: hypothetical protein HY534_02545 [Chloroflexi bacterium]|nr:hypothetical protein [Chloroflexota bacterium]
MADRSQESDLSEPLRLVERLLAMLRRTKVSELEVQHNGIRVHLRRDTSRSVPSPEDADPSVPEPAAAKPDDEAALVKSAHVGYFHRPDDGAFPAIGEALAAGARIGEVEVLGIRNPVTAPVDGILIEVLVEDDEPVEYGQILAVIQPQPRRDG